MFNTRPLKRKNLRDTSFLVYKVTRVSNHIFSKIRCLGFLVKNRNFVQKIKLLVKNRNLFEKSKFSSKWKFWSKIEILVKNRNFSQKSKFWSNLKFLLNNLIFGQKSKYLTKMSRLTRQTISNFLIKRTA